jgi:excisionase family DNA binding protein
VLNGHGISLADYLEQPTLASRLSREEACALLVQIKAFEGALLARLLIPESHETKETQRPSEGERLLTVGEVAVMLRYAESYVYELVRRGELRAVRHGKYIRIKPSAVQKFIASHER